MHSPIGPSSSRIFYGWYVVYAVSLVMMTTAGFAFYNLPVLLDAFVAERGFSVSVASNATAIFFIAAGMAGVISGQFVDRFDPRYTIMAAATMASLALLTIGRLTEAWQLFAFYAVFGFAYGGCGLIPTTTLVARWFERRRALALSIASTGLSLGGVVVTPISVLLILNLGLAGAAPWLALAFFLGVVPATYWIVRASPLAMGLSPDGEVHDERTGPKPVPHHIPLAQVWRSRFFIAGTAAFLFALGAQVGGISHVYRLANTRVGVETAATAVALLAISSLVGRLLVGWLLLWIGSRTMTFLLMLSQTLAMTVLAFAHGASFILIAVTMFGLNTGSMLMMQPLLLAEAFGVRDYGRIYSISQLVGVFGYAAGPALVGFLYEASGGYTVPYLAIAASSLLGMAVFALAGPTRQTARPV
jgi:MFS family permease